MTTTTQAAPTPGPWTVRSMTRVYAPDGGEVAVATKADPSHRHAAEANARLIAAAPDLLAALKGLLAESESNEDTSDDCVAAEDVARAAIAKAEGQ